MLLVFLLILPLMFFTLDISSLVAFSLFLYLFSFLSHLFSSFIPLIFLVPISLQCPFFFFSFLFLASQFLPFILPISFLYFCRLYSYPSLFLHFSPRALIFCLLFFLSVHFYFSLSSPFYIISRSLNFPS